MNHHVRHSSRIRVHTAVPFHIALLLALRDAPLTGLPLHDPPLTRPTRRRAIRG